VAYYIAILWATLGHTYWAWPVTMTSGCVLTMFIGIRKGRKQPGTSIGRAIAALWSAMGISMLLLFPALVLFVLVPPEPSGRVRSMCLSERGMPPAISVTWKLAPALAAGFNAVLPGSGYFYANRPQTAG